MNKYISGPKKGGTILIEPFDKKPYMPFKEAAKLIGLPALAKLIDEQTIDYHIVDDRILVRRSDVERLINEQ